MNKLWKIVSGGQARKLLSINSKTSTDLPINSQFNKIVGSMDEEIEKNNNLKNITKLVNTHYATSSWDAANQRYVYTFDSPYLDETVYAIYDLIDCNRIKPGYSNFDYFIDTSSVIGVMEGEYIRSYLKESEDIGTFLLIDAIRRVKYPEYENFVRDLIDTNVIQDLKENRVKVIFSNTTTTKKYNNDESNFYYEIDQTLYEQLSSIDITPPTMAIVYPYESYTDMLSKINFIEDTYNTSYYVILPDCIGSIYNPEIVIFDTLKENQIDFCDFNSETLEQYKKGFIGGKCSITRGEEINSENYSPLVLGTCRKNFEYLATEVKTILNDSYGIGESELSAILGQVKRKDIYSPLSLYLSNSKIFNGGIINKPYAPSAYKAGSLTYSSNLAKNPEHYYTALFILKDVAQFKGGV